MQRLLTYIMFIARREITVVSVTHKSGSYLSLSALFIVKIAERIIEVTVTRCL